MIDIINSLFELSTSIIALINIYRIIKDKKVRGVEWRSWIFYTIWSFWACYYYVDINHIFSFVAAISVATCNVWWLTLSIKYRKN